MSDWNPWGDLCDTVGEILDHWLSLAVGQAARTVVYALAGAETEEEFYLGPWWGRDTFTRSLLVTEEMVDPNYVSPEMKLNRLIREREARQFAAMDQKFWDDVAWACNPESHPCIVLGGQDA